MEIKRPRKVKLKSPGKRPKPQRCKVGASQLISIKASNVTINQRNIVLLIKELLEQDLLGLEA